MNALTARGRPVVRAGLVLTMLLGAGAVPREATSQAAPRSLIIEVLAADGAEIPPRPVAKAMVRVEGSEDALETNERGRAKVVGIAMDRVMLQIMVAGAGICRLTDVPVVGGDQIVSIVIDKTPHGKCRRLE